MNLGIGDLNSMHIDVLKEIGNIGAGNAATALAKLLNKKVDMTVPKVKILEFKEVNETLGGAEIVVVGILFRVSGDISGNILFILSYEAAAVLVEMLMGSRSGNAEEFSEIELSALEEIGNILAGSYLSALAGLTNMKVVPSVPHLAIDMAGAILSVPAIEFGKLGDTVLYIETEFFDTGNRVVGDFFMIPDVESYSKLLKALGVYS